MIAIVAGTATPTPETYTRNLKQYNIDYQFIYWDSMDYSILLKSKGVLFTGGGDINPILYHQPLTNANNIDIQRDIGELAIFAFAIKTSKKILGICRGIQLAAIALEGRLMQNIETDITHTGKDGIDATHQVNILKNSKLYNLLNIESLTVNSWHHQAALSSDVYDISAYSPDGITEAIEAENLIAVQWHPERMSDETIYKTLLHWADK